MVMLPQLGVVELYGYKMSVFRMFNILKLLGTWYQIHSLSLYEFGEKSGKYSKNKKKKITLNSILLYN